MQTQEIVKLLDEVLGKLEAAGQAAQANGTAPQTGPAAPVTSAAGLADAIDREIGAAPRQTAIVSLRNSPVVEQFRRELETESLTVTTATAFLQLLQQGLSFFRLVAG